MPKNTDVSMQYGRGAVPVSRGDRAMAAEAKAVWEQDQLANFEMEGLYALAGKGMKLTKKIDDLRYDLAGKDETLHRLLARFESKAVAGGEAIIDRVLPTPFPWGS